MKGVTMTRIFTLAVVAAALMLAAAAPAATGGKLTGTVGPGFTITMTAKSVKAGTYTITIRDRSDIHNFHLVGPGINNKTSVGAVKTYTWRITLKHGTYRFNCDVHASIMHGVLHVT
jgi:plastocyanin